MANNGKLNQLKELYGEIADLQNAGSLLHWDQQTYMPPRGAEARSLQMATLEGIVQEKITAPALGDLINELKDDPALGEQDRALLRELAFYRDRRAKLPQSLVKEFARETSNAFGFWVTARSRKDFRSFAPVLEKIAKLVRQLADCYGWSETPWNALAEDYERGLTAAKVEQILTPLRDATITLLDRILGRPQVETRFLDQRWDIPTQREFGLRVARDLGYDMGAGRQDVAAHPFCTSIGLGDVRITTRYTEESLVDALFGTMHEAGHALYDQGVAPEFARTPLDGGISLGIHESQSRFWEVRIGQSLPFWNRYLPILQQYFPGRLDDVTTTDFYRAVNEVQPDFIRVEADEVCYNLHIIIRFELELALMAGDLSIADLPGAWNEKYKKYLGLDVPDDAKGCLQDIHWSGGSFGYFPTYSLGNIYNAMLVEKMEEDLPGMWRDVEAGRFERILGWLRKQIHRHGRVYLPEDLMQRVTGKPISSDALVRYLEAKYGDIYGF